MAKFTPDNTMDSFLNYIKTNTANIHICTTAPAAYASLASVSLGSKAHTITGTPGDYASGRQLAVDAASSINITGSGLMAHVALAKSASSLLIQVTTIPASSQASVSSGNIVNTSTYNIQIADPT